MRSAQLYFNRPRRTSPRLAQGRRMELRDVVSPNDVLLEEPMVLDPQIRDWVVLPMVGIMVSKSVVSVMVSRLRVSGRGVVLLDQRLGVAAALALR